MPFQELEKFLKDLSPVSLTTADDKAIMEILSSNANHIAHSSRPVYNTVTQSIRHEAVLNIKELIACSVLIETTQNNKKITVTPEMNRWKAKKQKNRIQHSSSIGFTCQSE